MSEERDTVPPTDPNLQHQGTTVGVYEAMMTDHEPSEGESWAGSPGPRRRHRSVVVGLSVLLIPLAVVVAISTGATGANGIVEHPDRLLGQGYTAGTDFTFSPEAVPSAAISASQAFSVAGGFSQVAGTDGSVPTGVTENAYFGTFSDSLYEPRDVWLIVYSGVGVDVPLGGFPGTTKIPVSHEDAVVIDASTGQFLEETMASNMPALPASPNFVRKR